MSSLRFHGFMALIRRIGTNRFNNPARNLLNHSILISGIRKSGNHLYSRVIEIEDHHDLVLNWMNEFHPRQRILKWELVN